MSKLDAQRAMRAARYDAAHAASSARTVPRTADPGTGPASAPAPRPARTRSKPATAAPSGTAGAEPVAALCGHRSSIGGKSCRRPAGHTETTHRYT